MEDARRVAAQLDIPHYVFNFSDDFTTSVVDPYVDAYASGRTPNPCVECNRSIKFGRLLDRADALGFDLLATGSSRACRCNAGRSTSWRVAPIVPRTSRTCCTCWVSASWRGRLFPVGELTKVAVRARAADLGLRTANKPESMDVCFVKKGGRLEFLEQREPMRAGVVVDTTGAVLGDHAGVASFTIGQRRGVGVATGERRYVVDIDSPTATITLGSRDRPAARRSSRRRPHVRRRRARRSACLLAQVRAHGEPWPAYLDGDIVRFVDPQPRVARGQVIALYDGDAVVGGGIAA